MYSSGGGAASSPACRMSPITPTTVLHGPDGFGPIRTCWPIGSSVPNTRRAIASLTTTTGGAFGPSSAVKPRPRLIGMPIASK